LFSPWVVGCKIEAKYYKRWMVKGYCNSGKKNLGKNKCGDKVHDARNKCIRNRKATKKFRNLLGIRPKYR
jgi:hypothetical protein